MNWSLISVCTLKRIFYQKILDKQPIQQGFAANGQQKEFDISRLIDKVSTNQQFQCRRNDRCLPGINKTWNQREIHKIQIIVILNQETRVKMSLTALLTTLLLTTLLFFSASAYGMIGSRSFNFKKFNHHLFLKIF